MSDNLRLLKNIFTELQGPLFLGDGLISGEFHALLQPGQFISGNIKEDDGSKGMLIQANLANIALDSSFIFKPLLGSLDSIYKDILTEKALPYVALSDSEQAEIKNLTIWLANNEPAYTVYMNRYYDVLDAYNQEANAQVPNQARLQRLQMQLNQARTNWRTFGQKDTYENKQARVVYLSEGDPSEILLDLENNFQNSTRVYAQTTYQQTFLQPAVSEWTSPGTSWGRFEKTINESDSYSYSDQTSWGAGGGGGWGLFSVGISSGGSSTYQHSHSDVSTVSIAFDYMRVRLVRPWLESNLFNYRFWWWKKQFGYRILSDGGNLSLKPPVRPIGQLPFLPEYVIVARNLVITSNFSSTDSTFIQTQLHASASFGWGPFACSGSYDDVSTTQSATASFDGTSIRIDQPQIIAYTGPLMPLCPNPDRTLPWQGDQAPFDPPTSFVSDLKSIRRRESDDSQHG